MSGLHLTRTGERGPAVEALAQARGGRVGLAGLLDSRDGLSHRGRRAWAPGRHVGRAWTFAWRDRTDPRWWPQGITTSGDAGASAPAGRRLVLLAWYAKVLPGDPPGGQGVRVTVYDLDTARYEHVLVVVPSMRPDGTPSFAPLRAHAGGLLWAGDHLHVAATARGFLSCRLDDLVRAPAEAVAGSEAYGYRWLLPVTCHFRAGADDGVEPLRYSFLSLDRETSPPSMVIGEYGRGARSRRLARVDLDPDTLLPALDPRGRAPVRVVGHGVAGMQGAVVAHGRWYVTTSHGRRTRGSLLAGQPGDLDRFPKALPMGCEDLSWWPETDELWSASEHPVARWIHSVRRTDLD